MPAQPTSAGQNTGLVVIVVGIFMVIIAFLAVTYLNSDTIRSNQEKNSQKSAVERASLTQITCAVWNSIGDDQKIKPDMLKKIQALCDEGKAS